MRRKPRVLIADDNIEFCSKIKSEFETITRELDIVGFAHDGRETLQKIISMKPDMLLLDIVMPEMDGFGVLEALNEMKYCHRPCISILSVLRNDIIVQRAMELGADYYISKTISTADMVKRIFDLIGVNGIDHITSKTEPGVEVSVTDSILSTERSEELVKNTLQQLGLPQHLLGYKYLKDAIIMSLKDQAILSGVTKKLYPEIARKYNTTSARVERSMRHSIEVTWIKSDIDILNRYFGYSVNAEKGKPTNSEFIALLSDRISMNMAR